MSSKQFKGIDAGRRDCWMLYPEDLTLVDDKTSPFYDPRVERPVDDALVASIAMQGVLQPITVKKDGDDIIVVYGRQRVKAAREVNRQMKERSRNADRIRIPCVVQRGDDLDLFCGMIAENELRSGDDPMSRATKAAKVMQGGKTREEAAVVFGVSVQTIKAWEKILDTSTAVRAAVRSGKISTSAAAKLAGLSTKEQEEALAEAVSQSTGASKAVSGIARSMRAKAGRRVRLVRHKAEVTALLEVYKDAAFTPVLRWFLGEDCDFEALSK